MLLIGKNPPAWPIAFFGILLAGATAVPVDSNVEAEVARTLAEASRAVAICADRAILARVGSALPAGVVALELDEVS